MSTSKPTVILLPGGFHSPAHYGPLVQHLTSLNVPCEAVALPSIGAESDVHGDLVSHEPEADIDAIRAVVTKHVEQLERDVIVVAHSYSGFPATGAITQRLSKPWRTAQGLKGGVVRMMFIAALTPPPGTPLFAAMGNQWPSWIKESPGGKLVYADPELAKGCYSDLETEEQREFWAAKLRPQAAASVGMVYDQAVWLIEQGPELVYLVAGHDKIVETHMQVALVESLRQDSKREWKMIELASGHSPFLSMVEECARCIVD